MDKGSYTDYIAFYQVDTAPGAGAGWGWKRATDADDVINFLNKQPPYSHEIEQAEITAVDKGSYIDFIVFYRQGHSDAGSWGWKKATDEDDVRGFLSGTGPYATPVANVKVVAVGKPSHSEYYVFYTR